jgi:hypothetical protein
MHIYQKLLPYAHSVNESLQQSYSSLLIYIYKDLLHRNSLKYVWGYKIVPTTNLQHYHFMYSCR